MKVCFLRSIVVGLFMSVISIVGNAVPANPGRIVKLQPDGSAIAMRMYGDEFAHWCTTSDGYLMTEGSDGYYYYARINGAGALESTGVRAMNVDKRTDSDKALLASIGNVSELHNQIAKIYKDDMRRSPLRSKARVAGQMSFPSTGERKALAILVEFPAMGNSGAVNFSYENPRQLFYNMLNQKDFDFDGSTGSVRDYFLESSHGSFDLTFDVYGPIMMKNPESYYGNNKEELSWEMAVEACSALESEIDFSQYDQDGDGVIDNVYIFYAGENEPDTNNSSLIWPHAANIDELVSGADYSFGGYHLNHYACSNELTKKINETTHDTQIYFAGIGNVCHEFSHVLGLPDLYNIYDQLASFTPNSWSVMDVGSYNNKSRTPPAYSAFERMSLNWIAPYELGTAEDITLQPIHNNQACIIKTPNENEYFLLENRQQSGWDKYLPGHGMLIWHIAYDAKAWADNTVNINHDNQRVDIEEADDYRSYDSFDGDAFPGTKGVTSFTDETSPNSHTMVGDKPTGVPITDIAESDEGVITFKVNGGYSSVPSPEGLGAEQITPVSFVAKWNGVLDAASYEINVSEVNAEGEATPLSEYKARSVSENSCFVSGLQPDHTYRFFVQSIDEEGKKGAPSDAYELTLPEATFAYIPPVILPFTGVKMTEFTMNWEALDEAESYKVDVYELQQGEPEMATADFTGGISALPLGWNTTSTMTISTNGNYGAAAPAVSFSADGAYIQTPTTIETVRGLDFWYRQRNNPSVGNAIVVSAICGDNYEVEEIDRIELPGELVSGQTYTLSADKIPANTRAFRISYSLSGKGALAIDDVNFYYGDNFVENNVESIETEQTSYTFTNKNPNTYYKCQIRGKKGDAETASSVAFVTTLSEESAINEVEKDTFSLRVSGGMLIASPGELSITVYDIFGRIVAKMPASECNRHCVLPSQGFYIVSDGRYSQKIVW